MNWLDLELENTIEELQQKLYNIERIEQAVWVELECLKNEVKQRIAILIFHKENKWGQHK